MATYKVTPMELAAALRRAVVAGGTEAGLRDAHKLILIELEGVLHATRHAARHLYGNDTERVAEEFRNVFSAMLDVTANFYNQPGAMALPESDEVAADEIERWHLAVGLRLARTLPRFTIEAGEARLARSLDKRDHLRSLLMPTLEQREELKRLTIEIRQLSFLHSSRLSDARRNHACWAITKLVHRKDTPPLNSGRIPAERLAEWYGTSLSYVRRMASTLHGDLLRFGTKDEWCDQYPEIDNRPYSPPDGFAW